MKKAIGERLKKVKTYERQQEVLTEWAQNWQDDQRNVIARLRYAASNDRHGDIMHMIQQLEGLTEKRFGALNNVFKTLSDPDRSLSQRTEDNTSEVKDDFTGQEKHADEANCQSLDEIEALTSEIVKGYNAGISIREMSQLSNISEGKIVKVLVTYGVYTSIVYDKIKQMRECGKTEDEIANYLEIGRASMSKYTPYSKGIYGLENPSENAKKIRELRKRKAEKQ